MFAFIIRLPRFLYVYIVANNKKIKREVGSGEGGKITREGWER